MKLFIGHSAERVVPNNTVHIVVATFVTFDCVQVARSFCFLPSGCGEILPWTCWVQFLVPRWLRKQSHMWVTCGLLAWAKPARGVLYFPCKLLYLFATQH